MRYTTPMIIALTLLFSSTLIFAQGGRRKYRAKNDTIDVSVKKPFWMCIMEMHNYQDRECRVRYQIPISMELRLE